MYRSIKSIVRFVLPKRIFFQIEPHLRRVHHILYTGNNVTCNVCNANSKAFIKHLDYEKVCVNCGSLSRDRRLCETLKSGFIKDEAIILDFSPSRSLYRRLSRIKNINYNTTDLSQNFMADYSYDITNLDCENDIFDLIICYHILEHIPDDKKAMDELYRVLKPNGTCIIQTPFKDGEIYEDESIVSETDRLKHFGQEDHVRVYSIKGLKQRLERSGFSVMQKDFNESSDNRFGFASKETILLCRK